MSLGSRATRFKCLAYLCDGTATAAFDRAVAID
jgi:hypothetical protein